MKVTFPHMGHLHVLLRTALAAMGLDVVVPPPITKKTLQIGSSHAPEFACLPLKINLGNFLEARELGADTVVMAGGVGPCRFGYYAQLQREILKDMKCEMDMVVIEPPDAHPREVVDKLRALCRVPWPQAVGGIGLS